MKYILILLLEQGTGVISADRMALTSAEFDDFRACDMVVQQIKASAKSRVTAHCFPKASKAPEPKPE